MTDVTHGEARAGDTPSREGRFREQLYEAVLYGLGRTISLYDPASTRILVREMGYHIREYLEELGYHPGGGRTPEEAMESIVAFFAEHGFVDLEMRDKQGNVVHAVWHRLLGLRAYERILATGGETFISCPLNAVLSDTLDAFGKQLVLRDKRFNLEQQYVESWEEVVDQPGPRLPASLSLDAERLLELEREQSRQLRVRDEFILVATHELATPLTSTKLAVNALSKLDLPEPAQRKLALVNRQVARLEYLVAQLLDTTRFRSGRVQLQRQRVDLTELVRSVVELLEASGMTKGYRLELHAEQPVFGHWDPNRLEQVVTNLLTNALKYGRGNPIEVVVGPWAGRARLTVRDQGIGIPREALERIFDPFERAVPAENYGGLGLGLFIVRSVVEMHGGTVSVESEEGRGSTFTVVLPAEPGSPG